MAAICTGRCAFTKSMQNAVCRPWARPITHRTSLLTSNGSLTVKQNRCMHQSLARDTQPILQNSLFRGLRCGTCSVNTRNMHRLLRDVVKITSNRKGTHLLFVRAQSEYASDGMDKNDILLYCLSVVIFFGGMAYAGVPFFKMFCRQFGLGGNPDNARGHDKTKVGTMERVEDRMIKVNFDADKHISMLWNFKPQQSSIMVKPGETALAFYTAENPTDEPIIGISTYTVSPYKAAPYFNKIQCFCFEEQILNPHEQVDMPVFFYIDPEYDDDPNLEFDDEIVLSYTFFKAKEGMNIHLPGFITNKTTETEKSTA